MCIGLFVSVSSTCPYYYEIQPPNHIDCNPSGSENLAVRCTACAVKPNNITLEWMRQIEEENILLENNSQTIISNSFADSHSSDGQAVQCISSQLVLVGNSTEHYGRFFCQIKDKDSQEVYNSSSALPLFQPSTCTNSTIFASSGYTCAASTPVNDVMPPLSSTWMETHTTTVVTTVTVASLTVTASVVVTTTSFVQTSPSLASYCDGCCSMQVSPSSVVDSSISAATSTAVAVTLSTLFAVLIILIVIAIGWMAVKVYVYRQSEMQFDEITCYAMKTPPALPVIKSCGLLCCIMFQ